MFCILLLLFHNCIFLKIIISLCGNIVATWSWCPITLINIFKKSLQVNYPWYIQLNGYFIIVCYYTFSELGAVCVFKAEWWHVIGGILIPLDESGIINSYTILFGVNCIFFHNCFNSLLSFLCRLQVVLCHLLFFCGERTAPKIMPHIFVASPKTDVQRIPKMAINMLS